MLYFRCNGDRQCQYNVNKFLKDLWYNPGVLLLCFIDRLCQHYWKRKERKERKKYWFMPMNVWITWCNTYIYFQVLLDFYCKLQIANCQTFISYLFTGVTLTIPYKWNVLSPTAVCLQNWLNPGVVFLTFFNLFCYCCPCIEPFWIFLR